MRLLLVDNDRLLPQRIKEIFGSNAFSDLEVLVSSCSEEVSKLIHKEQPDFVFLPRQYLQGGGEAAPVAPAAGVREDFFALVVNNAGGLLMVTDGQGRISCFNQACELATGYSLAEVSGKRYWDIFMDPEEIELTRSFFENLKPDDFPYEIENCWVTKNGGRRLILWSNTAIVDEKGSLKYCIGNGIDITERKQEEENLRKRNEKISALLHASPLAVISLDMEGRVSSWSAAAERVFGWTEQEALGGELPMIDPEAWTGLQRLFTFVKGGSSFTGVEVRCRRKDGSSVDTSLSTAPLHDYTGSIVGVMLVAADITERKAVEKALKESEQRMADIINFLPDATFAVDLEGKVIAWNRAIEEMTSIKAKDIIGKGDYEYALPFYGTRRPMLINLVLGDAVEDSRRGFYTVQKLEDNSLIKETFCPGIGECGAYIWSKATPLYDINGNMVGAIESLRDITERKQVEEQLKYLSFHDSLTGLFNRVYFEEELKRLDSERMLPLSIINGDVNGLKLVNDAFGHHEGDLLLSRAAAVFKKIFRKEDVICRWGGDEFAVILPRTDEKTAGKICLRIRQACSKAEEAPIPLSISLGAATREDISRSMRDVLKEAEDRMYRNKLLESKSARNSVIASLQKSLAEKTNETEEHAMRIQDYSLKMGYALDLSIDELDELTLLSALHDIGKIAIPDNIINKPGRLTEEEWETMKRHCEIGYRIVMSIPELAHVSEKILAHHEHWDGKGYPRGFKGKEIPFIARIVAIVDAYDVMTTGRTYRKAMSKEEALKELEKCAGSQFDPYLVEVFTGVMRSSD